MTTFDKVQDDDVYRFTSEFIETIGSARDFAAGAFADGFLDRVAGAWATAVERGLKDASNSLSDARAASRAAFSPLVPVVRKNAVYRCTSVDNRTTAQVPSSDQSFNALRKRN